MATKAAAAFSAPQSAAAVPAPAAAPAPAPAVMHELPQPEPLANLIDFGNLHKVLAYILDNLKSSNARLTKLENNVTALSETSVVHGDALAALKALLLTFKPGGGDDVAELREKVAVLSGRVDSQTKEIVSLASVSKEQSRQLSTLEAATASLETIMPTKADISDLASKASRTVVERHERELEDLGAVVRQDHEARIKVLEAGLKRLSGLVDELTQDDFKAEAIRRITELEDQAKLTAATLGEHGQRFDEFGRILDSKAAQATLDSEIEALLARLRELELALAQSMKGELKRFERDVMIYVADQLTGLGSGNSGSGSGAAGGSGSGNTGSSSSHSHAHMQGGTAAGRMHFRCLTCDRPHDNVPGAQTFRYAGQSKAGAAGGVMQSDSRLLETQLGDQVYLHGSDGNIYKGRSDTPQQLLLQQQQHQQSLVPHLSSSDALLRLQSPSSQSTHRSSSPEKFASARASGSKSRPQSADPSRAHAHRQDIDPASGRKSAMQMQLPLSSLAAHAEAAEGKEQSYESATARTLFPSPHKQLASARGNSTSRALTSSSGAASPSPALPRSNSSSEVGPGSPSSVTPLASVRRVARPSTAQSSREPAPGGGVVLQGRVQQSETRGARTKAGNELVQDLDEQ